MATELPGDCLESILKKLSPHDFKSATLISKHFHSISNNLIFNLNISHSKDQHLPLSQLLHRFTSLRSLHFHFLSKDDDESIPDSEITGDRSVVRIAHSGLKHLEELVIGGRKVLPQQGIMELGFTNMRTLKILSVPNFYIMSDTDLSVIASSLPWLEELNISGNERDNLHMVTDEGIAQLAVNLRGLRRINVSGNRLISDQSLHSLLSRCDRIAEIDCCGCEGITVKGLIDAICGYPNLISLKFGELDYVRSDLNCCCLHLRYDGDVSGAMEHILASMEAANLPLHKLVFCDKRDFTDSHLLSLLKFLTKLRAIVLKRCFKLTNATFCRILKYCPFLTEFKMCNTEVGYLNSILEVATNHAMKTLKLNWNRYLTERTLKRIVLSFPNLECLEICRWEGLTEEGIGYVLNKCPQMKRLKVNGCGQKNAPWSEGEGHDSELKLEVLSISRTEINDKGMAMIAKRCPNLLRLEIECCKNVSAKAVKEMMERCKSLREIWFGESENKHILYVDPELRFDEVSVWLMSNFADVPDWMIVSEGRGFGEYRYVVHTLVRKMM